MLKVSFNINNIQNTLQRHYRRVQTVLRLEQNVLEDRDEIKKKVFRENHQNNYKRQYGFFSIKLSNLHHTNKQSIQYRN